MNILIANTDLVFTRGNWQEKLGISFHDSGNTENLDYLNSLRKKLNIAKLLAYRAEVGLQTCFIVKTLVSQDLKKKVDPTRVQRILDIGAITVEVKEVTEYWSRRTVMGLLLMPASRHIIVHLNEAAKIRKYILK